MSAMVNSKLLFLGVTLLGVARGDVRYTLKCEIESSDKMMARTGALQDAMRDCTSQILQTAEKQLTRNGKVSQILEYGTESLITINHEKKTWTRNAAAQAEMAAQQSMQQLKQMGAVFRVVSNPISETKQVGGFEAKGIVSVLEMSFNFPGMPPGMSSRSQMEFWVSDTAPGAKEIIAAAGKNGAGVSPTLRLMGQFLATVPGGQEMLKDAGKLVGQLVEMTMKMETKGMADVLSLKMTMRAEDFKTEPIPAAEFAIPDGYTEVK
jgi:hypothetical protein